MSLFEKIGGLNIAGPHCDFDEHGNHRLQVRDNLNRRSIAENLGVKTQLSKRMLEGGVYVGIQTSGSEYIPCLQVLTTVCLMQNMMSILMPKQRQQFNIIESRLDFSLQDDMDFIRGKRNPGIGE